MYINRVDISVTNRCTLNCEGCNMLMSYYCNPQDRKLDEIKRDLDAFFEWVDTVVFISGARIVARADAPFITADMKWLGLTPRTRLCAYCLLGFETKWE